MEQSTLLRPPQLLYHHHCHCSYESLAAENLRMLSYNGYAVHRQVRIQQQSYFILYQPQFVYV